MNKIIKRKNIKIDNINNKIKKNIENKMKLRLDKNS